MKTTFTKFSEIVAKIKG